MCGITGYLSFSEHYDAAIIKSMTNTLQHRGPNDQGYEVFDEEKFQLAFGHRRLSIMDVSSLGHQPMNYKNLWITYNGEVYNFSEIKETLIAKGHEFSFSSDTEVILHASFVMDHHYR